VTGFAVKFEILKNLENIKIKISKKTRVYFKIFGQNQIQKFERTRPTKFIEVQNIIKIMKKENRHRPVSVPSSMWWRERCKSVITSRIVRVPAFNVLRASSMAPAFPFPRCKLWFSLPSGDGASAWRPVPTAVS
jgi:hypothetical protein